MSRPRARKSQARYRLVVTETGPEGTRQVLDETGDAYVLAVGWFSGARLTANVDHDGPPALCQRMVAFIVNTIFDATQTQPER